MQKILLLEDEPVLGEMYRDSLRSESHEVILVDTAEKALAYVQEKSADIIVIDHGIKGRDVSGMDILPSVRKALPKAYIIMLSNYSYSQFADQALEAGANKYFVKINMSPKELKAYIQTLSAS